MTDAGWPEDDTVFLHKIDYPEALGILNTVLSRRADLGPEMGFEPDENGATVSWQRLATGKLSTSEQISCQLAHGIARLERHGGALPAKVRSHVIAGLVPR